MESATENNRQSSVKGMLVRVKMCGKSAQLMLAMAIRGKPYLEQDKIGMCRSFVLVKTCGYVA